MSERGWSFRCSASLNAMSRFLCVNDANCPYYTGREIMLRQTLDVTGLLIVVTSCALLASCATPPTAALVATGPTVEAKVTGTPQQLLGFDQALRPLLGTEPVACTVSLNAAISGCEILQSGPPSPTLKDLTYGFFGPHTSVYEKLGVAFNQVQKTGALTVAITPAQPPKVPDCSSLPPPCVASPWCPQTGGCSKQKFPCAAC